MVLKKALEKTSDEWMDIFINQTSNVAAETFLTSQQGLNHSQVAHNHHVVEVDDPHCGKNAPGGRAGPPGRDSGERQGACSQPWGA